MACRLKAALRTTLAPEIGPLLTSYLRNLAAYVIDFEGRLVLVPPNCARFGGARFVRNLAQNSENPMAANWQRVKVGITLGVPDPRGGIGAWTVTATDGVGNYHYTTGSGFNAVAGITPYTSSVWLRRRSGNGQVMLITNGSTSRTDVTARLTTQWQRLAEIASHGNGQAQGYVGIDLRSAGDQVDMFQPLLEDVTGQSNPNPSEYVPNGTGLAWPYMGAGVDGCQFFDYANGNTVTNNVITEAKGAAIPDATLKRYRKEKASTNYEWPSCDFTAAQYVKRNGHVITADQAVAPDGTMTADLITVSGVIAGTNQGVYFESTGFGNGAYCRSLWLRSGSGVTTVTMVIKDRASDTVRATSRVTLTAGWTRPFVAGTTAGATAGVRVEFQAEQNGTFYAWQGQTEPGTTPTSEIVTTTGALARPEDVAVFPRAVLYDAEGIVYATAEADDWSQMQNCRVIGGGTTGEAATPLFARSTHGFGFYDGVASTQGGSSASGRLQGAASWCASPPRVKVYSNDIIVAESAIYRGFFGTTGVGIGIGGSLPFQGYIGDIEIHDTIHEPPEPEEFTVTARDTAFVVGASTRAFRTKKTTNFTI